MGLGCHALRHGVGTATIVAVLIAVFAEPVRAEACPPAPVESRALTRIDSATAVGLDDGTSLRFMSLLTPSPRDVAAPAPQWPPETEARSAVNELLREGRIEIAMAGAFRDRYGRRVAHAYISGKSEAGRWLQSAIIDAGHARVAPLPDETLCLREMFAREAVARAKRLGLWANPAYTVRAARETRSLLALAGTFQIVEGWIAAVGRSRNEVFLNFGRDWKWDFTAAVDLRRSPDREALVERLQQMKGRLVRVRGFIERRNGPFVSLPTVDAIEDLPEGSASGH